MRHRIGGLLAAALVSLPLTALAQGAMPKHEFGVDALIGYFKQDYTGADSHLLIMSPVDVRVGFLRESQLQWMVHTTVAFDSKGGYDLATNKTTSAWEIDPGVNAEWKLKPGTGLNHQMGPFITGGGTILLGSDGDSFHQFSLNAGIGTRRQFGSAAFMLMGFFQYGLESGSLGDAGYRPSFNMFGARVGISLYH